MINANPGRSNGNTLPAAIGAFVSERECAGMINAKPGRNNGNHYLRRSEPSQMNGIKRHRRWNNMGKRGNHECEASKGSTKFEGRPLR